MQAAQEVTIHAIAFVVQLTPIGTNLGLVHLLWAMVSGRFLQSRGAIHPALSSTGISDEEVRRSWSAFCTGSWKISELLKSWHEYVGRENEWRERRYGGMRVVSIDLVGFWRPTLQGWAGKHYHAIAGKALPAVVVGVLVTSGQIRGRRIPLIAAIVRCEPEMSEAEFQLDLLEQVAKRPESQCEVKVMDAGFALQDLHEAKVTNFVLRGASNATARRSYLPPPNERGRPAEYGQLIRPLPRTYKGKKIAATQADEATSFEHDGRTIKCHSWCTLVTTRTKVADNGSTFTIHVFFDPVYKKPLLLITDLALSPEEIYLIYKDRWPVEQTPLAAKQMIGLHRQFVFNDEACFRLPELALLAGNILTHLAAGLPPIPSGFWDRNPLPSPGRLRRFLAQLDFPDFDLLSLDIRKKNAVFDHLPKGFQPRRLSTSHEIPEN